MRVITTPRERTVHYTRTRPSRARFSAPDASYRMPWSAACITNTFESEFSVHTGGVPWTRLARRGLLAQAGAIGLVLVTGAFPVPGVALPRPPHPPGRTPHTLTTPPPPAPRPPT